jgi:hypothetical protein
MQEHPHFGQASQRAEKENTAGQASTYNFEFTLKILLRRRLNEHIHMKSTCIVI